MFPSWKKKKNAKEKGSYVFCFFKYIYASRQLISPHVGNFEWTRSCSCFWMVIGVKKILGKIVKRKQTGWCLSLICYRSWCPWPFGNSNILVCWYIYSSVSSPIQSNKWNGAQHKGKDVFESSRLARQRFAEHELTIGDMAPNVASVASWTCRSRHVGNWLRFLLIRWTFLPLMN